MNFEAVRREFDRLARAWAPHAPAIPLHRAAQHDGSEHFEELPGGGMALIVTERGLELARRETRDPDELLYWLFETVAYRRAWQHELAHRHPSDDPRRIAFANALDEIARISPAWRDRLKIEQLSILRDHPFHDGRP